MIGHSIIVVRALVATAAPALAVSDASVERVNPTTVTVSWRDPGPVNVYVADQPTTGIAGARLAIRDVRAGHVILADEISVRRYFLLRTADGRITRVAERLLPLAKGSNFRDLGGYEAAGGKHVRWGRIYRSAATPMLTDADVAQVKALGLRDMIDLRSTEERSLAPSRVNGVRYSAVGYSMMAMTVTHKSLENGVALYRNFPAFFCAAIAHPI